MSLLSLRACECDDNQRFCNFRLFSTQYNMQVNPIMTSNVSPQLNHWQCLEVPAQFATIQAALNYCKSQLNQLGEHGFLQIKIADGVYHLTQVEIDFFSDRVEIIGNLDDPSRVVLNFDNLSNHCGFLMQRGNGIFKINGLTINGTQAWQTYGIWANESYGAGIMCNYNSQVLIGSQVRINHFYYGIAARYGSSVRCEPGVIVQHAGDAGFFAYAASIDAQSCEAYHCAHLSHGLGFGFCAEADGFINADRSKSAHNHVAGFYALTNGSMWCHDSIADNNEHGYLAIHGGVLTCNSMNRRTNAYNNYGYGYYANNGGRILANRCLGNNNTRGGFMARFQSSIDITHASANHNMGHGFGAMNATLFGNGAEARFNQGHGYMLRQQAYLEAEYLMAYGNHGYGFYLLNAQATIPHARGWKNQQGRMFKTHSYVIVNDD